MLHVVVGILTNNQSQVLISQRRSGTHLAGMWEFPGGKLEPGETRIKALSRELREELGIEVTQAEPLIRIRHHYPERDVLLDVWKVNQYQGQPFGCEQQPLQWVLPDDLGKYNLPPADTPILKALSLPGYYVILDADNKSSADLHDQLIHNAANQCSLFLLRSKSLDSQHYARLATDLIQLSQRLQVKLLLNNSADQVENLGSAGLHLSAQAACLLDNRPLAHDFLLGVSCHNVSELQIAQRLDADFVLLSPVQHTQSHPHSTPLGWEQFSRLVDQINIPVYALGGLTHAHLIEAKQHGAQGLAGISVFQASH
jgi:8-oxo-dGTP diphosphatase